MSGRRHEGPSPTLAGWVYTNRKQIAAALTATGAGYLAWKAYHSQSAAHVSKLAKSLREYAAAAASLSSTACVVASDLHAFITSDNDELPQSLKQLNKLLQSAEVQATLGATTTSITQALSAIISSNSSVNTSMFGGQEALNTVIEAVLSDRGRSLVGMAVGLATKNATTAFCEFLERMQQAAVAPVSSEGEDQNPAIGNSSLASLLSLLASEQGEKILSLLITKSIKTAVSTYVDATTGYNVYDDLMSSIAKQEHRDAMSDIMSRVTAAFCREVVNTYNRARRSSQQNRQQHPHQHSSIAASPLVSSLTPSSSSSSVMSLAGHTSMTDGTQLQSQGKPPQASTKRRHSSDETLSTLAAANCAAQNLIPQPSRLGLPNANSRMARGQQQNATHRSTSNMVWLQPLADLAREKDIRSLAVEMVCSATREATRSSWELGVQSMSSALRSSQSLICAQRLHVLLTVFVTIVVYAMAPRMLVM